MDSSGAAQHLTVQHCCNSSKTADKICLNLIEYCLEQLQKYLNHERSFFYIPVLPVLTAGLITKEKKNT